MYWIIVLPLLLCGTLFLGYWIVLLLLLTPLPSPSCTLWFYLIVSYCIVYCCDYCQPYSLCILPWTFSHCDCGLIVSRSDCALLWLLFYCWFWLIYLDCTLLLLYVYLLLVLLFIVQLWFIVWFCYLFVDVVQFCICPGLVPDCGLVPSYGLLLFSYYS